MLSATFIRERGEEKKDDEWVAENQELFYGISTRRLDRSVVRMWRAETTSELRITQFKRRSELTEDKECSRNKEENAV